MHRRTFIKKTGTAGLITLITPSGMMQAWSRNEPVDLEPGFRQPPPSAYPHTFWFWMNGHVSKEGISLDLEAMKRIGISGVFNYDGGIGIPQGPVAYRSPEWLALKKHAILEAGRLGLDFTLHNCPGWSASGGPWITPQLAMQQITWSETYVRGGQPVRLVLPQPFTRLNYYQDVAVLAFPSLEGEAALQTVRVATNSGPVDPKKVNGQDKSGVQLQPGENGDPAWLQFEFAAPYTASSITFLIASDVKNEKGLEEQAFAGKRSSILLESSDDGRHFQRVVEINTGLESELRQFEKFITFDFPPTKARFFRLRVSQARRLAQVRFSAITRLANFMEKTGQRFMFSGEGISATLTSRQQEVNPSSIIDRDTVLDLTAYRDREGTLTWNAPPGNWTILRLGFTPLGTLNRAAPANGIGLECDKFNRAAIDFHFEKMVEDLLPQLAPLANWGKVGIEIDSYEAGPQNWTPGFEGEFQRRRQYNGLKYLPCLTGRIVGSTDMTERFLWDFRRTLADLMADNYYGRFRELCHQHGFTSYVEPYDKGPMEEMQAGSRVDVALGEFWNGLSSTLQGNLPIRRTPKLAASIAHINGLKIAGAEAFTTEPESAGWQEYPFALKALGDKMFTRGVNRMVLHRFAHQPHPTAAPGMTMGPWGMHFDRTNTWWNEAKGWVDYLARCQYLLQQGLFVSDLLYFTGEEANSYTKVNRNELTPSPPEGYDYDLINAEVLLNRVQIKNGRIVLPDGTSYGVLVLQDFKAISLELLRRVSDLVQQGMIMVGAKPLQLLGLTHFPDGDAAFQQLAQALWGDIDGTSVTQHKVGKGLVLWGQSLKELLQRLSIRPDFSYTSRSGDAPIHYIHRRQGDTHIYFLANERRSVEELVGIFRVPGKQPELWDPDTGKISRLPVFELAEEVVRVPLQLAPYGSAFVVFRSTAAVAPLLAVEKDDVLVTGTNPFVQGHRKLYKEVVNNFTIALWAKPENNIMLTPSIHMEQLKRPYTDYYALFPPPGKQLYGTGHATCGLAIGRNGVAVWEHTSGGPVPVLSAPVPLSGWSHVALVYKAGVPTVFVNGKQVQKGQASGSLVHPGLGPAYLSEEASYFNGDMSDPELYGEALDEERLTQLVLRIKKPKAEEPVVRVAQDKHSGLLFFQNGKYRLRSSGGQSASFSIADLHKPIVLDGTWQVAFPASKGAPAQITLPQLVSLHQHPASGVKYFSGTVTYTRDLQWPYQLKSDQRVFLDLGSVAVVASVVLNDKDMGIVWKRPYLVDITEAIRSGNNRIFIKVTNLWINRLIGDEQQAGPDGFAVQSEEGSFERLVGGSIQEVPEWYLQGMPQPANSRVTFTTWKYYTKESPLVESGLIGPVTLHMAVFRPV
jgi:hypothetical protein